MHPSAFGALRLRVPWCTYRPLSAQRCPFRRGGFRRGVAVGKMILDLCTQNGVGYLLHASRVQWVRVTICSESGQVRKEAAIRSLCRASGSIERTGFLFARFYQTAQCSTLRAIQGDNLSFKRQGMTRRSMPCLFHANLSPWTSLAVRPLPAALPCSGCGMLNLRGFQGSHWGRS